LEIEELAKQVHISKRQIQRDFKNYVGLSPKKYARILRFNYIFKLMQEKDMKWVDIAIQSGYFDQAHFIKNFKEFTGEEPSNYGFDDKNMSNFFLNKT
jgi:transcriptional regulator GlxA family with amidase domain